MFSLTTSFEAGRWVQVAEGDGMKATALSLGVLLAPTITWAGTTVGRTPAPVMDEPALLVLAVGLVGAGLALVRRRR